MAKSANPGELRTRIRFVRPQRENGVIPSDAKGHQIHYWENIFEDDPAIYCKWVNAHGDEVYDALAQELIEPATLTLRYSARVSLDCRVIRVSDGAIFNIISLNDVECLHNWLELKVARRVSS